MSTKTSSKTSRVDKLTQSMSEDELTRQMSDSISSPLDFSSGNTMNYEAGAGVNNAPSQAAGRSNEEDVDVGSRSAMTGSMPLPDSPSTTQQAATKSSMDEEALRADMRNEFRKMLEQEREKTTSMIAREREEMMSFINGSEKSTPKSNDDIKSLLPEDTFSLMAFVPVRSWTFCISSIVFIIQMATLVLLTADILSDGDKDENNPIGVPSFAPAQVRGSQLLAIIIAVISQLDVVWAINILFNGYDKDTVTRSSTLDVPRRPRSLKFRWFASNFCRFSEGAFCLAVTFMLIMRSESVRDLLLNFTAAEFVSSIDNGVFVLAQWGYFGEIIQRKAENPIIGESGFTVRSPRKLLVHSITLLFIFFGLFGGWVYISVQQSRGAYLTPELHVQFGDDEKRWLGYASGVYKLIDFDDDIFMSGRHIQYERVEDSLVDSDLTKNTMRFAYCDKDKRWTFVHSTGDPFSQQYVCQDWIVRSSETLSFDIPSTEASQWFVKTDDGRERLMQYIRILDADDVTSWVDPPCATLTADFDTSKSSSSYIDFTVAQHESGSDITAYGRPVYMHSNGLAGDLDSLKLVMSVGRRWAHVHVEVRCHDDLPDNNCTAVALSDYVVHILDNVEVMLRRNEWSTNVTIQGFLWVDLYVTFFSKAFDAETLQDGGSPIGLEWFRSNWYEQSIGLDRNVEIDYSKPSDLVFSCGCKLCPGGGEMSYGKEDAVYRYCDKIIQRASNTPGGSNACFRDQYGSIHTCGCPYVSPPKQGCSLCGDGLLPLDSINIMPFPGSNLEWLDEKCGVIEWELARKYTAGQCEAYQASAGPACGCQSQQSQSKDASALPYQCDISCPPQHIFVSDKLVDASILDSSYNEMYMYCGEIVWRLVGNNFENNMTCSSEMQNALTGICCVINENNAKPQAVSETETEYEESEYEYEPDPDLEYENEDDPDLDLGEPDPDHEGIEGEYKGDNEGEESEYKGVDKDEGPVPETAHEATLTTVPAGPCSSYVFSVGIGCTDENGLDCIKQTDFVPRAPDDCVKNFIHCYTITFSDPCVDIIKFERTFNGSSRYFNLIPLLAKLVPKGTNICRSPIRVCEDARPTNLCTGKGVVIDTHVDFEIRLPNGRVCIAETLALGSPGPPPLTTKITCTDEAGNDCKNIPEPKSPAECRKKLSYCYVTRRIEFDNACLTFTRFDRYRNSNMASDLMPLFGNVEDGKIERCDDGYPDRVSVEICEYLMINICEEGEDVRVSVIVEVDCCGWVYDEYIFAVTATQTETESENDDIMDEGPVPETAHEAPLITVPAGPCSSNMFSVDIDCTDENGLDCIKQIDFVPRAPDDCVKNFIHCYTITFSDPCVDIIKFKRKFSGRDFESDFDLNPLLAKLVPKGAYICSSPIAVCEDPIPTNLCTGEGVVIDTHLDFEIKLPNGRVCIAEPARLGVSLVPPLTTKITCTDEAGNDCNNIPEPKSPAECRKKLSYCYVTRRIEFDNDACLTFTRFDRYRNSNMASDLMPLFGNVQQDGKIERCDDGYPDRVSVEICEYLVINICEEGEDVRVSVIVEVDCCGWAYDEYIFAVTATQTETESENDDIT